MLKNLLRRFGAIGHAGRVMLVYLCVSCVWILFSDALAVRLVSDPQLLARVQTYKGLFFVASSALMIFYLVRWGDQRLKAENRAFRESQALAEGLIAASPVAIWIHDFPSGRLVEVSGAVEAILGYSASELLDMGPDVFRRTVHPHHVSRLEEEMRLAREHWLRTGRDETRSVEFEWRDGRGDPRWIYLSYRPFKRDRDGRVLRFIASLCDISERIRTETDLREEQAFTEQALASFADTVTLFDLVDGRPLRWNRAMNELSEYGDDEIRAMKIPDDFYDAEDIARSQAAIEEIRRDGSTILEMSLITKSGRRIPMEYRATIIEDEAGDPRHILSIGRDLTEARRAERESWRFLETSRDWIWTTDLDGRYQYSNPAVEKILGHRPDDLIGTQNMHLLHPEDRRVVEGGIKACIESKRGWEGLAFRWRHKDGRYRLLESSTVPLIDEDGEVRGFQGVDRDITNLHRAHDALRQERDRAQGYLDLAGVIFVALDRDGIVTLANPKCCEVLKCTQDEIVGRPWFETFVDPEFRTQTLEIFKQLMAGEIGVTEYAENPIRALNGEMRLIAWHNALIRDDQGRIIGSLSSGEDITERRQAELQLKQALDEIRKLKEKVDAENVYLRQEIQHVHHHGEIVSHSRSMKTMLLEAQQVAQTDSTVLVQGETGTGKELLVRAIHDMSARRDRPLVIVNCAAMPTALVESELFGREKGAYTGALTRQVGRFEIANGGTIFLDEIGELSPEIQVKLLRVIQEGQFERLGSNKTIEVDIRLLAATNRDLAREVRDQNFREDLFYRLNVFPISIPPLRERREDIAPLVWTFVNEFADKMGKRIDSISQSSLAALQAYDWPGNVRELRNVVERAMIAARGSALDIPLPASRKPARMKSMLLKDVEREHILSVVKLCQWRIRGEGGAAERLGLNPSTLESRMRKLDIKRPV